MRRRRALDAIAGDDATADRNHEEPAMKKLTPVLIVPSIEACLPFWVDRLGFTKSVEVPHDGRLGFVILNHGPVELMLQSVASVAADVPALAKEPMRAAIYVEVGSLEELAPIRKAVAGAPVTFAERKTFYGATEIGVRDPAGNAVTFAAFATKP
jgi:catechol 2,3-dioxygenase-like lactoylglutathione lyase family enzyme